MTEKELVFHDTATGDKFYIIDPRWFYIFVALSVVGVILAVAVLVVVIYGIQWIDGMNIVSRLFALLERCKA